MRNATVAPILILLLLFSTTLCQAQTVRGLFRVSGAAASVPVSNTVVVTVTFAAAPTSPTATFAALKYNKEASFQLEVDDNLSVVKAPYAIMQGGLFNGTTYPGKTFTDGCGNAINYRGSLAVNARSNFNNADLWGASGKMTGAEVAGLIATDWAVINHGYYHEPTGNFFIGATSTASQAGGGLAQNQAYTYSKLSAAGAEYIMRTVAVPSSHGGFTSGADSLSYLGSTSTAARDGYTGYPTNTALNTANNGGNFFNEETAPTGFVQMLRVFQDTYNQTNIDAIKAQIDDLLAKSSASKHLTMRLGTHTATESGMAGILDHLDSIDADRVWVCSMHEYLEYREIKQLCVKSQSLAGNVLTLVLDYSAIPAINRYRDSSLLITGGTISSVSVVGADSFSYNGATGLVNVFKKKTTGFPVPQ